MARLRLTPLTVAQVTLNGGGPGLTQLAADTLGNDLTAADGFDALFLQWATDAANYANLVDTFDSLLASMDFIQGALAAAQIDPLVSDFELFAASGDNLVNDLVGSIGVDVQAPTPPAAPAPPVVTSGGDSGNLPPVDPWPTGPSGPVIIYTDEPTPMPTGGGGGGGTGSSPDTPNEN